MYSLDKINQILKRNLTETEEFSLDSLNKKLYEVTDVLDFEHFLFAVSVPVTLMRAENVVLTNQPINWREFYENHEVMYFDQVVLHCRNSTAPILWNDVSKNGPRENKNVVKLASDFGLGDGITVPLRANFGCLGLLSFSNRKNSALLSNESTLLATYVGSLVADYINDVRRVVCQQQTGFVESNLTLREQICLAWVAEGKSSWEVSQIIGCSERTVNFHIQNASEKLNAFSRTQAVSKALLTGSIEPMLVYRSVGKPVA
ncbi:autoinducer binding domain-containing protein [Vibrio methylphosphonaticus]|uniref:autoinducer binding domain-containing protein n=1 Tax=Vibrio methylphosphonaticus TaxID=2946866 RepID=UPI002029BC64|nr:autoinducer binding domain-containing protein [Vibrio methylphosphonaticus]MCL9773844.1 autoinducer binding domain-containing protein [Vibrio methylphosphonaticus]